MLTASQLRPFSAPCSHLAIAMLSLMVVATSQCATQWLPGSGTFGTNGIVYALEEWDPDGSGPLPPRLAVGGFFTEVVTETAAGNVAVFDPATSTWSKLHVGVNSYVRAIAPQANGDLIVGGEFTQASFVSANRIARWNGATWSALGSGLNGTVHDLETLPNGDLIVVGEFTTAGSSPANRVARWDGANWLPLGTGVNGPVRSVARLGNGDLIVGGEFTTAGAVSANRIARWNGTTWSPLGNGITGGAAPAVLTLTAMPNGDVVAGGRFTMADSIAASCIARFDGTTWSPLGLGIAGVDPYFGLQAYALKAMPNGDVYVGGSFSVAGSVASLHVARWNGTTWLSMLHTAGVQFTPGAPYAFAMLPNGNVVAGGHFTLAGGVAVSHIAQWNGTSWRSFGMGLNNAVLALSSRQNGNLLVGGKMTEASGVTVNHIAENNGTNWSALGGGMNHDVEALAELPNGNLVAGGKFTIAGGSAASLIAEWNGTTWSPLGSGLGPTSTGTVSAVLPLPNGDIVVGGSFTSAGGTPANHIARWNGSTWSPLGSGMNYEVKALVRMPNGDIIAGGWFSTAGGVVANRIARWNGTTWSALGSGFNNDVRALATRPNGDLIAGGGFSTTGGIAMWGIARWNGSTWSALGAGVSGQVEAFATLPNGDLVVGGYFGPAYGFGLSATNVARWDGSSWSAFGVWAPNGWGEGTDGSVKAVQMHSDGTLVVGGYFLIAGGGGSAYVARASTTCPPTVLSVGTGCTGSGGLNVLSAITLPWRGSVLKAAATGLPTNGIALLVSALTNTLIPLSLILPQGVVGCDLTVSPNLVDVYFPASGTVITTITLPNTVAIVGQQLHQQVVALELDAIGAITAMTSTNALQLTIGSF